MNNLQNMASLVDGLNRNLSERFRKHISDDNLSRLNQVIDVIAQIDRGLFIPNVIKIHTHQVCNNDKNYVYFDRPIDIGYGQTCSSPSTIAFMAYMLELQDGIDVLEVGAGCGYFAAILTNLVAQTGTVITRERIGPLASLAQENLKANLSALLLNNVYVDHGDAQFAYLNTGKKFDRICYSCACDENSMLFSSIAKQLNPNGILLYPTLPNENPEIPPLLQRGDLIKKRCIDGQLVLEAKYENSVIFVPLVKGIIKS